MSGWTGLAIGVALLVLLGFLVAAIQVLACMGTLNPSMGCGGPLF